VYIYANNKLEHEKCRHNLALLYEKLLEDGDSKEESDEPLPSGLEDEDVFYFIEENKNHRDEDEHLHNNAWAQIVLLQPNPQ